LTFKKMLQVSRLE